MSGESVYIRIHSFSSVPPCLIIKQGGGGIHQGDYDAILRAMAKAVAKETGFEVSVDGLPNGTIFAP